MGSNIRTPPGTGIGLVAGPMFSFAVNKYVKLKGKERFGGGAEF